MYDYRLVQRGGDMEEEMEKVALMGVKETEIRILPFVCSDIKCHHEWQTAI